MRAPRREHARVGGHLGSDSGERTRWRFGKQLQSDKPELGKTEELPSNSHPRRTSSKGQTLGFQEFNEGEKANVW